MSATHPDRRHPEKLLRALVLSAMPSAVPALASGTPERKTKSPGQDRRTSRAGRTPTRQKKEARRNALQGIQKAQDARQKAGTYTCTPERSTRHPEGTKHTPTPESGTATGQRHQKQADNSEPRSAERNRGTLKGVFIPASRFIRQVQQKQAAPFVQERSASREAEQRMHPARKSEFWGQNHSKPQHHRQ